jgi:hypothetical protein
MTTMCKFPLAPYSRPAWFVVLLLIALVVVVPAQRARAATLPDLVVSNVEIDSNCRLRITIQNQGAGPLAPSAYQAPGGATVAFYKDGKAFGGWGLDSIDPQHALATPGGKVTWLRPSPKLVGTAQIKVIADAHRNVVAEANENNNSLSRSFTCTPQLPDLKISQITFTPDCRAHLRIENIGDDAVPAAAYRNEGAYVQRYLDGELSGQIMLGPLDPSHASQPPAGSVEWTDGSQYRATNTVSYALRRLGQEWNTANDSMEVPVPANCRVAVQQPPDLVVSDVSLDNSCHLVVTLTNAGPGPMPQSAYDPQRSPSINFYKDGAAFGGWSLNSLDPNKVLMNPGGTVSWTRQTPTLAGSASIRVNIDAAHELAESDETNNNFTKAVTCGQSEASPAPAQALPDLAITHVAYRRDCHPFVRLENLGDGPLAAAAYQAGGVQLQRYVDNRRAGRIPLATIDPGKNLQAPHQAKVWIDTARLRAKATVRYVITGLDEANNTANDVGQARVPRRCLGSPAAPSLEAPIKRPQMDKLQLERR